MFDSVGTWARTVLGIDPGLSRCGYGVVQRDGARLAALCAGVIRTPPSDDLPARLATLELELEVLIREVRPDAVAVERVLFQVNARTAIAVGQASGIALAVTARAGVPVTHYSPNEVKLAVAGDGSASKEQVQAMVARLLALHAPPRPADVADALALAICHASGGRLREATAGSPSRGRLARVVAAALAREDAPEALR